MSWDVAVEILEGRSEYNSWEYAYIRDAIRNKANLLLDKGVKYSGVIRYNSSLGQFRSFA